MGVETARRDYLAACDRWCRMRDCYEGSDAVKAAGEKYLPRLCSHISMAEGGTASDSMKGARAYAEYKLRALFYNATGRTVDGLSGAIHQRAPTVDVPDRIREDLKDVTLAGVSAEMFALHATREVMTAGRGGVLVDMAGPDAPEQRPYWVWYRAEDILDWRTTRRGGDAVLTMLVLREWPEEPDPKDASSIVQVEQRRLVELDPATGACTVTLYRKVEGPDPKKTEFKAIGPPVILQRPGGPLTFVPFTFLGPTGTSPDISKPPLLDLVEVNLAHYRGSADLKHGLHYASLPTPWVSGMAGADKQQGPLEIGSGRAWILETGGQAGMLEVAGPGFGAIRTDLQDMQKMMATLGARLLEEQSSTAETMGAVGMRHAGEHATLRTIAGAVEQALTMALQWHAWWTGTEAMPAQTKASFELNKDFFAVRATPDEVRMAMLAWQSGGISMRTFYDRIQRGGWTREGVSFEDELAEIAREGGPPGADDGGDGDGAVGAA